MKKIISLGLGLILALSCVTIGVSAATTSPEIDDVISNIVVEDTEGNEAEVIFVRKDKIDDDMKPANKSEKVIAQYNLIIKGDPMYPLSFRMNVAGIKKTSKVYILAKDLDGDIKKVSATVLDNNKITFTLEKTYASIAIVTDKKTASQMGTSDQTGDFATPLAVLIMVASLGVAITAKKIKI